MIAIILGCLVLIFGTTSAQQDSLTAARTKWEAVVAETEVPLVYSYGYLSYLDTSTGIPDQSVVVLVEGGNVIEVSSLYYTTDEDANPDLADYDTVEGLFDLIEDAINDENVTNVTVEYNEEYGYPMVITLQSINATDPDASVGVESAYRIDPMTIYTILQRDLDKNMDLWNETGVLDYDYTVQIGCFCEPGSTTPKRVNVIDGEIVNITDIETGNDEGTDFWSVSMMDLFENVQRAIDNKYYRIDVIYDTTYGFVARLYTDVDPRMVDEEIGYTVSDFVAVGGDDAAGDDDDDDDSNTLPPIIDGVDDEDVSDMPSDSPSLIPSDSPSEIPTSGAVDPSPGVPLSSSSPSNSSGGSPTTAAPSSKDFSSSTTTASPSTTTTTPPPPISESGNDAVVDPSQPPASQLDGSSSSVIRNTNVPLLFVLLGWYIIFS